MLKLAPNPTPRYRDSNTQSQLPDQKQLALAQDLMESNLPAAVEILFGLANKDVVQADIDLYTLIKNNPEQILPLYEQYAARGDKHALHVIALNQSDKESEKLKTDRHGL